MAQNAAARERNLGTRSWIVALVILLVALDALIFLAYRQSQPAEPLDAQLIGYLESSAFSVVTVSIVIPIILAFLNQFFNIGSAVQQRIETQKQEFRNQLSKSIKQTTTIWTDFYDYCGKVIFWRDYGESRALLDLLQEGSKLANKAEEVVESWPRMFRNLKSSDTDVFVTYLNIMISCTETVIDSIRTSNHDPVRIPETAELQESLGLVRSGIRGTLHMSLLEILNKSASLLTEDYTPADRLKVEAEIQKYFDGLTYWARFLTQTEQRVNKLYPLATGTQVDEFRAVAVRFVDWRKKDLTAESNKFPEWSDFSAKYLAIPTADLLLGERVTYSPETVKELARQVTFRDVQTVLNDRANTLSQKQ
jgi:hypothetical protein